MATFPANDDDRTTGTGVTDDATLVDVADDDICWLSFEL
jgi:hypothetical protein